jgi:glycosyltransferase involved in cell wall biosynthesis
MLNPPRPRPHPPGATLVELPSRPGAMLRQPMPPGGAGRILICCHDFTRGGTERIAIGLAKHWVEAGREVIFLCGNTGGGLRPTIDPRVTVIALDPPIHRGLISRLRLGRAMAAKLAQIDPDIVFLPGNYHLPLGLALSPALRRLPRRGALIAKISNPTVPKGVLARPIRWLLMHYQGYVDGVATMSTGLQRDLHALLPQIDARTLFDPLYLRHDYAHDPKPAGDARFHVLWAGRFEPQKDVLLALRSFQEFARRTPARLSLVGDGSQRAAVLRAIERMGLASAVTAPGYVPGLDALFRSADAVLVTSHFEGGPAVAVEALAHGVPVVSTDCSHFLRDIMTIPEAGRIVGSRSPQRLADALSEVQAAGAPEPARLGALIAHLQPEVCAAAYLDWFDTIARQRLAPAIIGAI